MENSPLAEPGRRESDTGCQSPPARDRRSKCDRKGAEDGRERLAVRMSTRIAVIQGDGIGPEVVGAALQVLEAAAELEHIELAFEDIPAGANRYREIGASISPEDLERLRQSDAIFKGPVGDPTIRLPDGTEAGLLGGILRPVLDCFANVRPIRSLLPVASAQPAVAIDYTIIRENTEGLYASRGRGVGNRWAMTDTLVLTRAGTERIVQFAFEFARTKPLSANRVRPKVTCVDKSNVLRSYGFFRQIFSEIAEQYRDVEADYMYADASAQALVLQPGQFDVLVMENFLGDLLSDVAAATIGGVGMCPSANVGAEFAYFEPVHGSAPSIAGTNVANPIGQILAAAMMLDHLNERQAADRIRTAVAAVLRKRLVRVAADGKVEDGTVHAASQVTEAVRGRKR